MGAVGNSLAGVAGLQHAFAGLSWCPAFSGITPEKRMSSLEANIRETCLYSLKPGRYTKPYQTLQEIPGVSKYIAPQVLKTLRNHRVQEVL